jgi:cell division protein FtsB
MEEYYSTYTAKNGTPPVRKRKRKSFWQANIMPLLKFIVFMAIIFTLVGMFWQRFVSPIREYNIQSALNKQAEADLAESRRQSREIERQIRYSQTPEGAAQAARKLGWVKPGEIILVLPNETPNNPKPEKD